MEISKIPVGMWVLSAIGLVDSLYLTWLKFFGTPANCIQGIGDCWSVNTSRYSEVYGIPVALLGILAYLTIIAALIIYNTFKQFREITNYIVFGLTLSGTMYSIYLTYLELFVIRAICPFCLLSAFTMLLLFILSVVQLLRSVGNPNP